MSKINKHIQIVVTSLKGINSMSLRSRLAIKKVLKKHYCQVGISVVNNIEDLTKLVDENPDLVFIGLKKLPISNHYSKLSDIVWVAKYLEDRGITTTGSTSEAIKLDQYKTRAKDEVIAAGLSTSPYFIAESGQYFNESQLPIDFPLFLKPPDRGAGVGVDADSVVRNFSDFESKVDALLNQNNSKALVEKYLFGREFTVALMLNTGRDSLMVMPIEQLPVKNNRGDGVIGSAMKSSKIETPVRLIENGAIKNSVIKLAKDVFVALGARDYGRIDIRLDDYDVPHFLEANLIPGLVDGSGNFQKACQLNLGMNHEQMILHIVNLAFARADISTQQNSQATFNNFVKTNIEVITTQKTF